MNPLVASVSPAGVPVLRPELVQSYRQAGWWQGESISEAVRRLGLSRPDQRAYTAAGSHATWSSYDCFADRIATALQALGLPDEARAAVLMPDGYAVHAAIVGCARAGVIAVGIGARAGDAELDHLIRRTQSQVLITPPSHRGRSVDELVGALAARGVVMPAVLEIDDTESLRLRRSSDGLAGAAGLVDVPVPDRAPDLSRERAAHQVSMLNSTSGTTGLPKCVTQYDERWSHFTRLAIEAGRLTSEDVVLAVVPTPFGFGLWTSHFLGPILGARTITMPRFTPEALIEIIDDEKVTVLCAVTTQFRMMLNSPACAAADLTSLRVMFTGGEAIPYARAVEFEERTGAALLQFFGSNESGALSYTTLEDPQDKRLSTSGRLVAHMSPRLFDDAGREVHGVPGQPGGRGPLTCAGYFGDEEANRQLFTPDGWLLMGDLVTVDEEGYLQLVGRASDIVIRGGKNISVVEVENAVETHPDVTLVAVVPVPDEVYGERVCAVVTLREGATLDLAGLCAHLDGMGVSQEWWPERLMIVGDLPRNAGGKIAKGEVRKLVEASPR